MLHGPVAAQRCYQKQSKNHVNYLSNHIEFNCGIDEFFRDEKKKR
jgi:hypothetical protein